MLLVDCGRKISVGGSIEPTFFGLYKFLLNANSSSKSGLLEILDATSPLLDFSFDEDYSLFSELSESANFSSE